MKVDGEQRLLEEEIPLDKKFKHTIHVVVDRLVMKADLRTRLAQSVETAARLAEGLVVIDVIDGQELLFSRTSPAPSTASPPEPSRGSSRSTARTARPAAPASGRSRRSTRTCSSRTRRSRSARGARPWAVGNSSYYESVIQAVAERYEIDLDTPWRELTEEQQNRFLYGTDGERVYVTYRNRMGRRARYMLAFEGIVASLERRYRETDSSTQRERIEEYMSFRPCPVCKGARLKPEVLAVTVGEVNIHEFTRLSVTSALEFVHALDLTTTEHLIGDRILKEIRERLTFLDNVGVGYLNLDPRGDAVRGRGAAAPPCDADREPARRRPLHPRRAFDRPPPA